MSRFFFSPETVNESFQIVFSLYPWNEWDKVLPQAFIVPVSPDGKITYYIAQAKLENLAGYGFEPIPPAITKALKWVDELSPRHVESYFTRHKKKKISLSQLFVDKKEKKVFSDYVDHRLSAFLDHCLEHNLILCWNLERKIRVDEVKLYMLGVTAKASMYFQKTLTGIQYKLSLQIGDETILPSQHEVAILSEEPAWIIVDQKVLKIEELPGVRLKPFLKKENLFIPQTLTRDFFEKFVLENLQKVDVIAEGFDHQIQEEVTSTKLVIRDVFTEDMLMLELIFYYGETSFSYGDPALYRSKLIFQDDLLSVKEIRRDKNKEETLASALMNLGFEKNGAKLFYRGSDRHSTLHHLQKIGLEDFPLEMDGLTWSNLPIDFTPWAWDWNMEMDNDWFDVYALIQFGGEKIPFGKLFPYIQKKNPFFPLDGLRFILIPEELMAQLSDLCQIGELKEDHFIVPKSRHVWLSHWNEKHATIELPEKLTAVEDVEFYPSSRLKATLRPYQIQGVKWMLAHRQNQLGCLLADDMGLGKTLQVISVLVHVKEQYKNEPESNVVSGQQLDLFSVQERIFAPLRTLVVLPASLVFNWYAEIKKFASFLHVASYTGPQRKRLEKTLETFDIVLTTYHTIRSDIGFLQNKHFEYIILDESQAIKNKDSLTFKSLSQLSANHKISLSGTPIENSLAELWSQMQFINPDVLGSFRSFEKNFLIPIQKNQDEGKKIMLKTLVEPYLLRRTKSQVAPELPDIIRQTVWCIMDGEQAKLYEKEKSAVRNAILDEGGRFKIPKGQVLISLLRLRQIASFPALADPDCAFDSGKFEDVKNELSELHEAGHKVLVFSSFTSMLDIYHHWAEKTGIPHVKLTGSDSAEQRKMAVELFQNNPAISVFFISLKAGGVGLNLTKADYVFILDPWWNPAAEEQALSRAHRIGREGNVVVKKFITKDSIEEKILALQEKKKVLAGEFILENELPASWDEEDIKTLLA